MGKCATTATDQRVMYVDRLLRENEYKKERVGVCAQYTNWYQAVERQQLMWF